jgi:hypothetical protein
MAAAKIRDRSIPIAEFEMPLADALALLLPPGQVQPGDTWTIHTTGPVVTLTRERAAVPNQGAAPQGAGRQ